MRYAHEFQDGWILVNAETGEHGVVLFKSKEEAEKDLAVVTRDTVEGQ